MKMIVDDFRNNLSELLDKAGYGARSALARHMNCSPAFITQLVKGDSEPSLRTVEIIADYFKVNPVRLLRKTEKISQ